MDPMTVMLIAEGANFALGAITGNKQKEAKKRAIRKAQEQLKTMYEAKNKMITENYKVNHQRQITGFVMNSVDRSNAFGESVTKIAMNERKEVAGAEMGLVNNANGYGSSFANDELNFVKQSYHENLILSQAVENESQKRLQQMFDWKQENLDINYKNQITNNNLQLQSQLAGLNGQMLQANQQYNTQMINGLGSLITTGVETYEGGQLNGTK